MFEAMVLAAAGGLFGVISLLTSVRVLREYERAVVFRLGRARNGLGGPGLLWLLPFGVDRTRVVDTRLQAIQIPPQEVITRDNISIVVSAVVYANVSSPRHAVLEVDEYLPATLQLAATTLRAVVGKMELDDILANREGINNEVRGILDTRTEQWGVEITAVELKDIELPKEMQRAMARQAEAERERRAKVIAAEGEVQAAAKLSEAARMIAETPAALQLRLYQTLVEVSSEARSTIVFPVPIDITGASAMSGAKASDVTSMMQGMTALAMAQAQKQLPENRKDGQIADPAAKTTAEPARRG
ncbi:MAG TPA: slipin family protein [Polyangia bacterium]